ncbi:hypothetical protein LOZ58_002272 [Ophidiomyces ophidiicola]|nr:hypothetical protein LOZ58_002272 [Ophidiomyces ophidiicola]
MPSQNQPASGEGPEVYCPGGFHPVYLGEVYNGEYEVLRKIGSGGYSTVWLVRNREGNFRALKVLSAECYGGSKDIYEREILERLRDADPSHLGYPYISTLVDSFEHDGPNGHHVCLVFMVMGETLRSFGTWFEDHALPNEIMRRFTIQLLLALDYAHENGIIHTDTGLFVDFRDLWNLGAVVLEVFRAVRMFSGRGPPDGRYQVRYHLQEIVDFFGPFLKSLLEKGDQELVQEYFDSEGRIKDSPPLERPALESEFFLGKLHEEDKKEFVMFLRSLMRIDSEKRKTTMELLAEPWLGAIQPKA